MEDSSKAQNDEARRARGTKRMRTTAAGLAFALLVVGAAPAGADEYDSKYAGHPLRFAAYLLHPVGVVLETLITKPAHWLVHTSALKGLFGHTD